MKLSSNVTHISSRFVTCRVIHNPSWLPEQPGHPLKERGRARSSAEAVGVGAARGFDLLDVFEGHVVQGGILVLNMQQDLAHTQILVFVHLGHGAAIIFHLGALHSLGHQLGPGAVGGGEAAQAGGCRALHGPQLVHGVLLDGHPEVVAVLHLRDEQLHPHKHRVAFLSAARSRVLPAQPAPPDAGCSAAAGPRPLAGPAPGATAGPTAAAGPGRARPPRCQTRRGPQGGHRTDPGQVLEAQLLNPPIQLRQLLRKEGGHQVLGLLRDPGPK